MSGRGRGRPRKNRGAGDVPVERMDRNNSPQPGTSRGEVNQQDRSRSRAPTRSSTSSSPWNPRTRRQRKAVSSRRTRYSLGREDVPERGRPNSRPKEARPRKRPREAVSNSRPAEVQPRKRRREARPERPREAGFNSRSRESRSNRRSPRRESGSSSCTRESRSNRRSLEARNNSSSRSSLERRFRRLEEEVGQLTRPRRTVPVNIRVDCIPEFTPGEGSMTTSAWINRVEQICAVNGWDEVVSVYLLQSRLSGAARKWYNNLESYNHSWDEWKSMLLRMFPDHVDFSATLRKLVNRKKLPGESMTHYFLEKMELIRSVKIDGREAVSCIIDGLTDVALQAAARAGNYETPEALFEKYLSSTKETVTTERRNKRPDAADTSRAHRNPSTSKCYNCGSPNHRYTNCSKPEKRCSKCNFLGHNAEECRSQGRRDNRKRFHHQNRPDPPKGKCSNILNINLAVSSSDTNSHLVVDCQINGSAIEGYLDQGSRSIMLRHSDAIKLGLELRPTMVKLCGYGGGYVISRYETTTDLKVDDVSLQVVILVVPDDSQQIPLIIGQPFTNHKDVAMIILGGKPYLKRKEEVNLPSVIESGNTRIALRTTGKVEIPSHHVGFISVCCDEEIDVFVDEQLRPWPVGAHLISACVINTAPGAVIPVYNYSSQVVCYQTGQVIARAEKCHLDAEGDVDYSCLTTEVGDLRKLTIADLTPQIPGDLPDEVQLSLLDLLNKYRPCIALDSNEIGKTSVSQIDIITDDPTPVTYRPYRMSYDERMKVQAIIQDLLSSGIIQESSSPYASPILLVKKQNDEQRLCIDFRALNRKTIKDKYPLPRIEDLLDRLEGRRFFTSLDLASGYYQIPVGKESIEKTAFVTPDGQYEFLRMPFGLVNGPAVFQRTMNKVLGALRFNVALTYLDDVLIPAHAMSEALENLEKVLKALTDANLTLRFQKCWFLREELDYLGYTISKDGVRPGFRKIKCVQNFPAPTNTRQLKTFLGLASYFRRFVERYAEIARPLTDLTKKSEIFKWGKDQQYAFDKLKEKLVSRPVLAPYRPNSPTEVHTDASKWGLAGILLQQQETGENKPVMYFSRKTSPSEQRFHSYELETLAVVETLKQFRIYLLGKPFKIVTDCSAVKDTFLKRDLTPRVARWWLALQEYDFEVEYRSGIKMPHVDALSRAKCGNLETQIQILSVDIDESDWLLAIQLQDDRCNYLTQVLKREPLNKEEEIIRQEYVLNEGRLCRKTPEGTKWVVPKFSRSTLLRYYHDDAGHLSVDKTLDALRRYYWFPSMRKYVRNYINVCLSCSYSKRKGGKSEGTLHIMKKAAVPFDTLHLDHLGPYVKSRKSNNYLIVVVDAFTKFTFLKAIKNTKTAPVIKFLEELISIFRVPRRMITDRGTAFTSTSFNKFCTDLGVVKICVATSTPRANGQVERMNRTINTALIAAITEEDQWDTAVRDVQWGLNTTFSSTTGRTPFELFFGFQPRGRQDSFITNRISENSRVDLLELRKQASQNMVHKQAQQKNHYDKNRKSPRKYQEGQQVLILQQKGPNDGKSRKLLPPYKGPFIIKKVLPNDRYIVEDLPSSKRTRRQYEGLHASDRLKPFEVRKSYVSSETESSGISK